VGERSSAARALIQNGGDRSDPNKPHVIAPALCQAGSKTAAPSPGQSKLDASIHCRAVPPILRQAEAPLHSALLLRTVQSKLRLCLACFCPSRGTLSSLLCSPRRSAAVGAFPNPYARTRIPRSVSSRALLLQALGAMPFAPCSYAPSPVSGRLAERGASAVFFSYSLQPPR
jgi:hypothetical protein